VTVFGRLHLLKNIIMAFKMKHIGFGDTVEAITKAAGIKKVVDKISEATGKDCGCDKRKEYLNKKFPY